MNGHQRHVNFSEAGTPWGCADHAGDGAQPNEHGTWWYGRGGWCDGQQVEPWVVDVTAWLSPAGRVNRVVYKGLYLGAEPGTYGTPGYIMMQSSLVLYVAAT